MDKQLAVIIPTYNMERYLVKCLDSLLVPDAESLEVFVVNDGSTDSSLEIAHGYAARFPDVFKVIDKPNGNYGSCINVALQYVTARYVRILDADDSYDVAQLDRFLKLLPELDDDALITKNLVVDLNGNVTDKSNFRPEILCDTTYSAKEAFAGPVSRYVPMNMITYARRVFDRFDYRQTEGVSYSDTQWAILPMTFCNSFRFVDLTIYRYLFGREGQTMAPEQIAKSLGSFFTILTDMVKVAGSYKLEGHSRKFLDSRLLWLHYFVYYKVLESATDKGMALLADYDKWLQNENPDLYGQIGSNYYAPPLKFRLYADLRRKGYPVGYHVPIYVKLAARLISIFGK